MSASMNTCSAATAMLDKSSTPGGSTTTPRGLIRASKGSRPSSLQPAPKRTITGTELTHERGQVGEQVRTSLTLAIARARFVSLKVVSVATVSFLADEVDDCAGVFGGDNLEGFGGRGQ